MTFGCDKNGPTEVKKFPDFNGNESWTEYGIEHIFEISRSYDEDNYIFRVWLIEEPQNHEIIINNSLISIDFEPDEPDEPDVWRGAAILQNIAPGEAIAYNIIINEFTMNGIITIPYTANVNWETDFTPHENFYFNWSIPAKPQLYYLGYHYSEYSEGSHISDHIQISKNTTSYSLNESLFLDADDYEFMMYLLPINYNYIDNDLFYAYSGYYSDEDDYLTSYDEKLNCKKHMEKIIKGILDQ